MFPSQDVVAGYPLLLLPWLLVTQCPQGRFPSSTQPRTEHACRPREGLRPTLHTSRSRSRSRAMSRLPASPAAAGGNTYLHIFGNLWACLFAGKSGSLPRGLLEARVAKGPKREKGQKWADGGGAEAGQGMEGEKLPQTWWGQRWPGCGRAWAEPPTCWVDLDKCALSTFVSTSKQLHPGSDRSEWES